MKKLTKSEEEVMHYIWDLGRCTVSEIISKMKDEPPHSTISSIVRILEKKGFVGHKAYGRTYDYFPLIDKETYGRRNLNELVQNYFKGSPKQLVSFLVKEEQIELDEINRLLSEMEEE